MRLVMRQLCGNERIKVPHDEPEFAGFQLDIEVESALFSRICDTQSAKSVSICGSKSVLRRFLRWTQIMRTQERVAPPDHRSDMCSYVDWRPRNERIKDPHGHLGSAIFQLGNEVVSARFSRCCDTNRPSRLLRKSDHTADVTTKIRSAQYRVLSTTEPLRMSEPLMSNRAPKHHTSKIHTMTTESPFSNLEVKLCQQDFRDSSTRITHRVCVVSPITRRARVEYSVLRASRIR